MEFPGWPDSLTIKSKIFYMLPMDEKVFYIFYGFFVFATILSLLSKEVFLVNEEFFVVVAFFLFVVCTYRLLKDFCGVFMDQQILAITKIFQSELERKVDNIYLVQRAQLAIRDFVNFIIVFFKVLTQLRYSIRKNLNEVYIWFFYNSLLRVDSRDYAKLVLSQTFFQLA